MSTHRRLLSLIVGCFALFVPAGSAAGSPQSSGPAGLLLWNTLGSADEITHSAYGPELVAFDCTDPTTPHFGRRCSVDVSGTLGHRPGIVGGAASIAGGPYFSSARVHTALLRTSILNPEHGAVEVWYLQKSDPKPFHHNPHRIFGGPYSLTGVDEVQLFSQDRFDSGDPRLHFSVFFGDEPSAFTPPHVVAARSNADGVEGYPISALNGRWIQVAGVWDRSGIAGTSDTVRLYVNGAVVASSKATNWGTTTCATRRSPNACFTDIAGCNDTCAGTFAVDELKVWDYAKTEFGVCKVPHVVGKTFSTARRAIRTGGCRLAEIHRTYSRRMKRGRVICETPKAGAVLPRGGEVDLVLSRGRKQGERM